MRGIFSPYPDHSFIYESMYPSSNCLFSNLICARPCYRQSRYIHLTEETKRPAILRLRGDMISNEKNK